MNNTPEIPTGPETMANAMNPVGAAGERIARINSAILGTALDLAPAVITVGLLVYGFRKFYQSTLGKVL